MTLENVRHMPSLDESSINNSPYPPKNYAESEYEGQNHNARQFQMTDNTQITHLKKSVSIV